jgi:hypothetical protein
VTVAPVVRTQTFRASLRPKSDTLKPDRQREEPDRSGVKSGCELASAFDQLDPQRTRHGGRADDTDRDPAAKPASTQLRLCYMRGRSFDQRAVRRLATEGVRGDEPAGSSIRVRRRSAASCLSFAWWVNRAAICAARRSAVIRRGIVGCTDTVTLFLGAITSS